VSRRTVDPTDVGKRWGWLKGLRFAPVALALACVPQNAGYEDVRTMVSVTGHDVRWNHVDGRDTTRKYGRYFPDRSPRTVP
jgi:hypothetical protein